MAESKFDLRDIEFETFDLSHGHDDLSIDTWSDVLQLRVDAFRDAYSSSRSITEIDNWIRTDSRVSVAEDFKNPQNLVDEGIYNPNQTLWRTHMTVAFTRSDHAERVAVGYLRSSDNTSGSHQELKKLWPPKRYRVIGEVAVAPRFQGRGIALAMAYGATHYVFPGRRSTAYAYPEENPRIGRILESLGYVGTAAEEPSNIFGSDRPARMYRYVAPSRAVARKIIELPGAREEIRPVRRDLHV